MKFIAIVFFIMNVMSAIGAVQDNHDWWLASANILAAGLMGNIFAPFFVGGEFIYKGKQ